MNFIYIFVGQKKHSFWPWSFWYNFLLIWLLILSGRRSNCIQKGATATNAQIGAGQKNFLYLSVSRIRTSIIFDTLFPPEKVVFLLGCHGSDPTFHSYICSMLFGGIWVIYKTNRNYIFGNFFLGANVTKIATHDTVVYTTIIWVLDFFLTIC